MALQMKIIPVTSFLQNATLLWDDESLEAVLTDVGGEAKLLLAEANRLQLKLQAIWLTHGHLDHVSGVNDLIKQIQIPVLGPHLNDSYWIDALPEITAKYGFPVSQSFTPSRWLQDGDEVKVGQYVFQIWHVPGHTPGHIVFYNKENKLLISGDVLFRETVGRTDLPGGSHEDLIENIRNKLLILPDDTRILPGHGAMTTIGHEKKYNPFLC